MSVAHKYLCTRTHTHTHTHTSIACVCVSHTHTHTHTHTAVKELHDEAARLRQTARSVSTENRLLLSALQDRERKMNLLQAANRDLQEQLGEVTEREGEVHRERVTERGRESR